MVTIYCDNEDCGEEMESIEEDDSRSEWYKQTYQCPKCNRTAIRTVTYDQNGLVLSDEVEYDND